MPNPIIGCVQLNAQQDIDFNLQVATRAIAKASQLGASLVVLPENMMGMGRQAQLAERFEALSSTFANLAKRYHIHILAGTLPCPYRPDGMPVPNGLLRQVSQVFDPSGQRLARYDKIHLFRAQVGDDKGSYDEGLTFEAGDKLVVAQCQLNNESNQTNTAVNIGMMVCFDLRFPALAQRLRSFGAEILTAPSAFTYPTGQAHWQLLLQARALDAQCMVVGASQGGHHRYTNIHTGESEGSRRTWGHATVTNANGEVVVTYNKDTIVFTDDTKRSLEAHTSSDSACEERLGVYIAPDYVLLTTEFNHSQQTTWRQNLPIHRCHRMG